MSLIEKYREQLNMVAIRNLSNDEIIRFLNGVAEPMLEEITKRLQTLIYENNAYQHHIENTINMLNSISHLDAQEEIITEIENIVRELKSSIGSN